MNQHDHHAAHQHTGIEIQPAGLASTRDGYTIAPVSTTMTTGRTEAFSFRIIGPTGTPVTDFGVQHEKRMHLIVIRRDTAEFQHVHPELSADGTWTVPLRLTKAGSYRAFADFAPTGGSGLTLGVDLAAPGEFQPEQYLPSREATIGGYHLTLQGDPQPGTPSKLSVSVRKDGEDVSDLQPYLGAYGHLVALRLGDLAYLHVHPDGEPGDGTTQPGPEVVFHAVVPSRGTYRLFLDFRHADTVRTAEFTVNVGGRPAATGSGNASDAHVAHDDHA